MPKFFSSIDHVIHEVSGGSVGDIGGGAEVVYFGGATNMATGAVYYFNSSGGWTPANATTQAQASGLLAVALGGSSDVNGMLLRGMVTIADIDGSEDEGKILFLRASNGLTTTTVPTTSSHIVRILGYLLHNSADKIWFNPDNTFVEID